MKSLQSILLGSVSVVLMATSAVAAPVEQAKAPIRGFVDGGWILNTNAAELQTFLVRDGAVYFDKSIGNSSVFVDLPFSSTLGGGAGAQTLGFNFDLFRRGQAYVHHKYDNGAYWQVGRFDKFFGVEANDTIDVRFTQQGLLYNTFIPRSHTGLLVGANLAQMFDVRVYAAHTTGTLGNPLNVNTSASALGTSTLEAQTLTQNYDFGGQIGMHQDAFDVKAGYRMRKDRGTNTNESLVDVMAGFKAGTLGVSLGADIGKYATPGSSTSLGFLGLVSTEIGDMMGAGIRGEYVTKFLGIDGANALLVTAGPQIKLNESTTFKVDYSLLNSKVAAGANSTTGHIFAADVLFQF